MATCAHLQSPGLWLSSIARSSGFSRRAQVDRPQDLGALHRGHRRHGCLSRRQAPERGGQGGDDRRPRRGDPEPGGGARDRPRLPRRLRGDRAGTPRLERQRQADRAGARARIRALPREPRDGRPPCGGERQLRPDRHGGLELHERHAPHVPRAARGRARQRRRRPPGVPAPDAQGHPRARALQAERPPLQGHLRRAAADRVPRLRGGARRTSSSPWASCSAWGRTSGSRRTTGG